MGESSRAMGTVGPGEPGCSPLAAGSPAPGWERVDLGVTSSQQYPEQALPVRGELQPTDCGLPRTQLGAEADGWQKGWSMAHTWGQAGTGRTQHKIGVETITGSRGWLQPVQR